MRPGTTGCYLKVQVNTEPAVTYWLAQGGIVRWNGARIDLAALAGLVMNSPGVRVTLHPRPNRYESSSDAEFVAEE